MEIEQRLRPLLLQGLEGDSNAYQRFLRELSAHLRAFLRRRLAQRPDEVEDLVQETLLAVHNQRHTYRPDLPVTAWAQELFSSSDSEAAQAWRDLGQLLQTLPDRQRLPIVHVKLEGLSVVETARITGLSESAVKVGVHRGLKALAARIRACS